MTESPPLSTVRQDKTTVDLWTQCFRVNNGKVLPPWHIINSSPCRDTTHKYRERRHVSVTTVLIIVAERILYIFPDVPVRIRAKTVRSEESEQQTRTFMTNTDGVKSHVQEETACSKQLIMIHAHSVLWSITTLASDQSWNHNLRHPTTTKSATHMDVAWKCDMRKQNWTLLVRRSQRVVISGLHVDERGPTHNVPFSCFVLRQLAPNRSECGFIIQVRNTLFSKVPPQENKVRLLLPSLKFSAHVHHPFWARVSVRELLSLCVFISQNVCVCEGEIEPMCVWIFLGEMSVRGVC